MHEEIHYGRRQPETPATPGNVPGTVLITGASSSIGEIYADRLARRGHDLILVGRNRDSLAALSSRLADDTGRFIKVIIADLNDPLDLSRAEAVLRTDPRITMLVNHAGLGAPPPFLGSDILKLDRMIDLNVTALVHLTYAVVPAFVLRGEGAIINITSAAGLVPEKLNGVFSGTKAFVLAFSRSLHKEFGEHGIRIQAVLTGVTTTESQDFYDMPPEKIPARVVMTAEDMVDAALAAFDRDQWVTIPSLPDSACLEAY